MADIVIDTVALPDGVVGVPYEGALAFHGNATALSASTISSGTKPPNLTLDVALPFSRLRGTPKSADVGTWSFKVTLTDTAGGTQSVQYTMTIHAASYADVMTSGQETIATRLARQWPSQY